MKVEVTNQLLQMQNKLQCLPGDRNSLQSTRTDLQSAKIRKRKVRLEKQLLQRGRELNTKSYPSILNLFTRRLDHSAQINSESLKLLHIG